MHECPSIPQQAKDDILKKFVSEIIGHGWGGDEYIPCSYEVDEVGCSL
jgi:hypothetical protein